MKSLLRSLLTDRTGFLPTNQRSSHMYVIGQPNSGKTRAMESWIRQDIDAGRGVGVIDPHGDLFQRLLGYVAERPWLWDKVVIINPCDPKWTVCLNPLAAFEGMSRARLALFSTDMVVKIWKVDPTQAPRMVWLLTNSFLALSLLDLTLLHLRRFLMERVYRERLLHRLEDEAARAYFMYEYPKRQGAVHEWATPVLNKLGSLIFDPDVRLMFASSSQLSFRQVLDRQLILLVNLSKGILGEAASSLLGAFIVALLQKAALSRADTNERTTFYLYLDEFQNYTTDNINDILSESRKYCLSLILAHQYLDQLSKDLRSAALNTTQTIACFRVGFHDAEELVGDIFPSHDFMTKPGRELHVSRFGDWPLFHVEEHQRPLGWDGLAQLLAQLPQREFWLRQRGPGIPTRHRTLDVPDPEITPEMEANIQRLLDMSGRLFGRLKSDVQREADARRDADRGSAVHGGVPFWSG